MFTGRLLGLVMLAGVLAGCGNGDSMESFGGPTMGSTYSIKYVRHAGLPEPTQVRSEVEGILGEVDRQLSTYRNDSDIERFNALPANSCQKMPAVGTRIGPHRRTTVSAKRRLLRPDRRTADESLGVRPARRAKRKSLTPLRWPR